MDNRRALEQYGFSKPAYTPPGAVAGHYLSWYKWDSARSSTILAAHGYIKEAVEEFETSFSVQDPLTGFIPNMARFVKRPAWKEFEWTTFDNDFTSNYSQPALEADNAVAIYEAYVAQDEPEKANEFLVKNYDRLDQSYAYWRNYRQISPINPLVFVIHSNETGRDSCPVFDGFKYRLPRNGVDTPWIVNSINPALDYLSSVNNGSKNKRLGWDPQKIRQKFEVVDVMFNCLYQKNLLSMAKISKLVGNEEKTEFYTKLADNVEQMIIKELWDPLARNGKGAFYPVNKNKHIHEDVAANLYPLLLPNLPEKYLMACLDQYRRDFNTPYPIPTVATNSRNFDPHFKEKGIMWRSLIWQWINYDLRGGLSMQAARDDIPQHISQVCLDEATRIEEKSEELVTESRHENHDPYTGEGYRTPNFAGSASGWRLPKNIAVIS